MHRWWSTSTLVIDMLASMDIPRRLDVSWSPDEDNTITCIWGRIVVEFAPLEQKLTQKLHHIVSVSFKDKGSIDLDLDKLDFLYRGEMTEGSSLVLTADTMAKIKHYALSNMSWTISDIHL